MHLEVVGTSIIPLAARRGRTSVGVAESLLQAIDHPADVVGAVDDAVSGDVIDAAEVGGDGGLGFDFGVGTQRDGQGNEGIPRSGT